MFNNQKVFMSNPIIQRDTGAWQMQVWISFGLAVFLCGTGLAWLPGQVLDRAFMVMGYIFCLSTAFLLVSWLYLITTTFTLAKTLRDKHEADLAEARLQARSEARREMETQ